MDGNRDISRYEKSRILSSRSLQIFQGAPPLVEVPQGMTDPLEIARLEWDSGVIPIQLVRKNCFSKDRNGPDSPIET